jgi:hypothetical protein
MSKTKAIDLSDLHTQMVITNRLLAAQLKATMKQGEIIDLLSSTGATSAEVAQVLNVTAGAVRVQNSRKSHRHNGAGKA